MSKEHVLRALNAPTGRGRRGYAMTDSISALDIPTEMALSFVAPSQAVVSAAGLTLNPTSKTAVEAMIFHMTRSSEIICVRGRTPVRYQTCPITVL
jgi:hypothetical protein